MTLKRLTLLSYPIIRIFVALALVLSLAPTVFADVLDADGDGVMPIANQQLNFGTVCVGSTTSKPTLLAIRAAGHPGAGTNNFANSAVVAISVASVSGTGLSAIGGGSVALPSNWLSLGNGAMSSPVASSVTLVAGGAPGAFSGTVTYQAVGSRSTGGSLTRNQSMPVIATIVNCDTTPPVLSLPGNMTVEATGPSGAVATFSATATDANPSSPAVTCVPPSGAIFPLGTTSVNCQATDAAGNTAYGSFTITVQDTRPPTIADTPSNITVEATGPSGAEVTYTPPTASDLVDGSRPVSCSPTSGATFPLGTTMVTCSASDSRGNTATSSFDVSVQDTTAPVLALPADIAEEATGPAGAAVTYSASASDLVDGSIAPTCAPPSGSTFPLGTTAVGCSASDSHGNTASGSFNVKVRDTTPPALSLPGPLSAEATGPAGAAVSFSASATDIVDGLVAVSCSAASGDTFALGTTTVNCSATDARGNTASGSFTVTVVDTTPPVLTLPPDQLLEATSPAGAVATFAGSASDLVDGAVAVSCSAASGSTFPLGVTVVSCSATDAHGNTAMGSFSITVQDTIAPTVICSSPDGLWHAGDVSIACTATDGGSGLADPADASFSLSTSVPAGTETDDAYTSSHVVTDAVGNSTTAGPIGGNKIDKKSPAVSCGSPDGLWHATDVSIGCAASDGGSGLANPADASFSLSTSVSNGTETDSAYTDSRMVADAAGNSATAGPVGGNKIDKKSPAVSCGSADGLWHAGDVSIACTASDGGSGLANPADASFSLSTNVAAGTETDNAFTGSHGVADAVGNSATAGPVGGNKIDKKSPVLSCGSADGLWHAGDVSIACTASDGGSGLANPADASFSLSTNVAAGTETDNAFTASHIVADAVGNSTTADPIGGNKVDKKAPQLSGCDSPDGVWHANNVTLYCAYTDGGSGPASQQIALSTSVAAGDETDNAAASASGAQACDGVSNCADSPTDIAGNKIDRKGPSISIVAPAATTYVLNQAVAADYSCADGGSGLASCNGTVSDGSAVDTASVGPKSFTVNAVDVLGNASSQTVNYGVQYAPAGTLCYGAPGHQILQPINADGTSVFKQKSTVPAKFRVCDASGNSIGAPGVVTDFKLVKVTWGTSEAFPNEDPISTTPDTAFRWSASDQQWIFNINTKNSSAGRTYFYRISLNDGSAIDFSFGLK